MNPKIGYILGRLSEPRKGKIQSFPWESWQWELQTAALNELQTIEWTIDSENFDNNPFFHALDSGLLDMKSKLGLNFPSVTFDFYMESPYIKNSTERVTSAIFTVLEAMGTLDTQILVIPLVDNGSITSDENQVIEFFLEFEPFLVKRSLKIAFESDYDPDRLHGFIEHFPDETFGINYDMGNSAHLNYPAELEFEAYGNRIINVHVKDRLVGGSTVPFGMGNVDFPNVFRNLNSMNYNGNYILQPARAENGRHLELILEYSQGIERWVAGTNEFQ